MDDVTRFLQAQGLQPQKLGFLGSDFFLGYQIETARFSLTYRQQEERLILCDFTSGQQASQSVLSLMALLRRVVQAVPSVRCIDAMILAAPFEPEKDQARRRLNDLMLAEGAQPVRIDGGVWLRYRCP